MSTNLSKATFAGGCFWCIESAFIGTKGVTKVTSGYTGGSVENPTYEQVGTGQTGHFEAVQVDFDPKEVSFEKLVEIFWLQIDPTDPDGQFADRGSQYRTAIFYFDEEQKRVAEKSKEDLEKSGKFSKPIATQILPAKDFYPAEDYHQQYAKKNPLRYNLYKVGSGRAAFIEKALKDEH
jgi:methionine-S-sulfoxide reductase